MKRTTIILTVLFAFIIGGMNLTSCNKDRGDLIDNSGDNGNNGGDQDGNNTGGDTDNALSQKIVDSVNALLESSGNLIPDGKITYASDGGEPLNIKDNDVATFWTPQSGGSASVVFDLSDKKTFNEVDQFWNDEKAHVTAYTVLYSNDTSVAWFTAYIYPFEDGIGSFYAHAVFPAVEGRFVKIVYTLEAGSDMNLAEVAAFNNTSASLPDITSGAAIDSASSDWKNYPPSNLIDGDEGTYWQPLSGDRKDDEKLVVSFDLGSVKSFNQAIVRWTEGHQYVGDHEILYSEDKSVWETAYSTTDRVQPGPTVMGFPTVKGRYVKFIFHLRDEGQGTEKLGEIEIYNMEK